MSERQGQAIQRKPTRTLPLVRVAFISLIVVVAASSCLNFIWLSGILSQSTHAAQLGRSLTEGYRQMAEASWSSSSTDPMNVAALRDRLAARSDEFALTVASTTSDSIRAMAWTAVSSFGAIAVGIGIMVLVSRRIARPVALMLEANRRLAKGRFPCQVAYDARDEMGALAASFNRMSRCIQRSVDIMSRQKAELETRVRQAAGELRALSLTDELTGLPNLRHLREVLRTLAKDAGAAKTQFLLVMVEVKDFLAFNDAFGREAGDLALAAIARSLRAAARECDFMARHGGVCFVLLMPGLSAVPKGFLSRVEAELESLDRRIRRHTDRVVPLSLSVGSARFPADGESLIQLTSAADRAAQRFRTQPTREPLAAAPTTALAQDTP